MAMVAHELHSEYAEVRGLYDAFMSEHRRNSPRTVVEYDSRVREFFKLTIGRDIEFLSIEDIKKVKNKDVQTKFVDVLLERGNSENTIITKLYSVSSFYNTLLKNDIEVNPKALDVELKAIVKHHEALTLDEYLGLLEFMKDEDDGLEKYLYTKLLYHTGGRKTATLHLTWDDFRRKTDSDTGKDVWVIEFIGKGRKPTEKPISDDFYAELRQLEEPNLFPVLSSSNGAYKRYERSLKKYGKRIDRNISIHDLKATALRIAYLVSKDPILVKQLGSHESFATTEIYIGEEKSYTKQLSYGLSKDLNESKLLNMSHDELLKFIMDNQDIKLSILLRLGNKSLSQQFKKYTKQNY